MSYESEANLLLAASAVKGMLTATSELGYQLEKGEGNTLLLQGRDLLRSNPAARRDLGGDCYLDVRTASNERLAKWLGWIAITLRDDHVDDRKDKEDIHD